MTSGLFLYIWAKNGFYVFKKLLKKNTEECVKYTIKTK